MSSNQRRSIILGFIVPLEQLTPELLARGAPTLIDLARPSLLGVLAGVAIAAVLVPPLATVGYKLANQILEGQTRPYTLPVSKMVWKAIRHRAHQEHGVTFLSANRFGIEHTIDMVIILTALEPVSAEFISDLKQVANDAYASNLNIGVYVLQEAAIKRSKF